MERVGEGGREVEKERRELTGERARTPRAVRFDPPLSPALLLLLLLVFFVLLERMLDDLHVRNYKELQST